VIDTHAHVHDAKFDADRSETIARARAVGVEQIVLVGCDLADTERAIQCAREFSLHASIGIHPHEAAQAPEDIVERFDALYDSKHVVAIGEIGLDYFYTHSPPDVQQRILREQLAYASTHRLPTIFHQRDAFEDFIGILREAYDPTYGGVVHCFTGDSVQASQLVDEFGLRLGIGGVLTFKNDYAMPSEKSASMRSCSKPTAPILPRCRYAVSATSRRISLTPLVDSLPNLRSASMRRSRVPTRPHARSFRHSFRPRKGAPAPTHRKSGCAIS